jgi:hypothetical protein
MRTKTPDEKWLKAVEAARKKAAKAEGREQVEHHYSEFPLLGMCWQEGLGHEATAIVVDVFVSCHPKVISGRTKAVVTPSEAEPPGRAEKRDG